jgi:hypothetical protein
MRTHPNFQTIVSAVIGGAAVSAAFVLGVQSQERSLSGREIYEMNCASCHAFDGGGRTQQEVGFELPLPDFRDCTFASRENNGDWGSIVHEGGPRRAFNRLMPAFGEALTPDEIEAALNHIRTFCTDKRWPRGEFNLPLAMFTEKAFPEDESVWWTSFNTSGATEITTQFTYEKRFGPRGQLEITLPLKAADQSGTGEFGIGDIGLAWKQNFYADLDTGLIMSAGAEALLPTGDDARGFGKGTVVFEPFFLFGKILPGDSFVQGQLLAEFPMGNGLDNEVGWRAAFGKTWTAENGFGRAWTPMIEVLGARELVSGAQTDWDIVPQMQISLSQRQHILFNAGARVPLNDSGNRDTQFIFYVIWDWFDGGLFEGWR